MDNNATYTPLKRHSYPLWVIALFLFSLLSFFVVIPDFMKTYFLVAREVSIKTAKADAFFHQKEYKSAAQLYKEILLEYPDLEYCKDKIMKAYFALSDQNNDYFVLAVNLFCKKTSYKETEIDAIERFVPKDYREYFRSLYI